MSKKTIGILGVVAMMLAANTAWAGNGRGGEGFMEHREDKGFRMMGQKLWEGEHRKDSERRKEFPADMFFAYGEIKSVSNSSLVVHTMDGEWRHKNAHNVAENSDVTIRLNADTDVHKLGKDAQISDLKAGMKVVVTGSKDGDVLTARHVRMMADKKVVYGEVTAVDDDSMTIKDSKTGQTQVVPLDEDTKVVINGEVESASEIEVGDKGFVKIKSVLGEVWTKIVRLFR